MKHDLLFLWFLGDPEIPRLVGRLRLVDAGKGVSLQYAPGWLVNGFALSEDLPLIDIEQLPRAREKAVGAVDDARPDRWGERVIQYIDRPGRLSLMEYLFYAGDDRFGALGVSTSDSAYLPKEIGPLPRLEQVQQLSDIVQKVNAKEAVNALERRLLATGGSFGGAKPKALIEIAGEQWIIKFYNNEPVDVPLIEHASMTLAAQAGITVAETRVIALPGENALAVRRYDRAAGRRIHCLSAGTALRAEEISGQEPTLGYPNLALLLRRSGVAEGDVNELDRHELFRRMVFNILIDNTDDHEKNHALMVVEPSEQGKLRLAPAYDVLPTNSGQGDHQFVIGDAMGDPSLVNAMSQCEFFGLTPPQAALEVKRVIEVVDKWREHFETCGVTASDLDSLAERIDGNELVSQRATFDPTIYAQARRPRRRGPFA